MEVLKLGASYLLQAFHPSAAACVSPTVLYRYIFVRPIRARQFSESLRILRVSLTGAFVA